MKTVQKDSSISDQLEEKARQNKALEMRKAGVSLEGIVTELGYTSPSDGQDAMRAALSKLGVESVKEARLLELARLDSITKAIYESVLTGDLNAVDLALRISEMRTRLLGLDTPDN